MGYRLFIVPRTWYLSKSPYKRLVCDSTQPPWVGPQESDTCNKVADGSLLKLTSKQARLLINEMACYNYDWPEER